MNSDATRDCGTRVSKIKEASVADAPGYFVGPFALLRPIGEIDLDVVALRSIKVRHLPKYPASLFFRQLTGYHHENDPDNVTINSRRF
ncbi:hypothetical protein [Caballeronia sp. GAOx1]|uniref:hypothetical protein n=1 Tax=Caballeronia sp. GAOx1 TaxID=2921761 RepID=UPI002028B0E4|nr:hypothetical protein [Caballeronia sp. GAOx1]